MQPRLELCCECMRDRALNTDRFNHAWAHPQTPESRYSEEAQVPTGLYTRIGSDQIEERRALVAAPSVSKGGTA